MNAQKLFLETGDFAGMWFCTNCRLTVVSEEELAEKCCRCSYCQKPVEKRFGYHAECWDAARSREEAQRLEKAHRLESWDGWVFLDGAGSNNGYFESLDDLREWAEDSEEKLPEWVFVAVADSFDGPSMDHIQCTVEEGGYEDIWSYVDGEKELAVAIDAFNEKNAGLVTYMVDHKRVVSTRVATAKTSEQGVEK